MRINKAESNSLVVMAFRRACVTGVSDLAKIKDIVTRKSGTISDQCAGCLERDARENACDVFAAIANGYGEKEASEAEAREFVAIESITKKVIEKEHKTLWTSLVPYDSYASQAKELGFDPEAGELKESNNPIWRDADINFLFELTFEYAIGRYTYVSTECNGLIKAHLGEFKTGELKKLHSIIATRCPSDSGYHSDPKKVNSIGLCDVASWSDSDNAIVGELKKRGSLSSDDETNQRALQIWVSEVNAEHEKGSKND
jgi:hypothetical protein